MTQRTLVRIPGQEEKEQQKHHKYSSPPICKTGTWSCTGGAKHTTVSHCTTNGSGGTTGCPHRQWEAWLVPPASSLPGLQECS